MAFIKYIYCMFQYLKFPTSLEWRIYSKRLLCLNVLFVGLGLFLCNTEDNHNTTYRVVPMYFCTAEYVWVTKYWAQIFSIRDFKSNLGQAKNQSIKSI